VNPNDSTQEVEDLGHEPSGSVRSSPARQTPDGIEQRLLNRMRAAGFARGDRLIVGFSGGRDSLALAAALRWPRATLGVEPLLVHVDHRLRASSAHEASRAAELGAALGLETRVVHLDTSPRLVHPGVGIEGAARRERYRLLFAVAAEIGANTVVTAHHQQDQAETVLLHLLRGGGVHGAAAMGERTPPPLRISDISHEIKPWLWRPFLHESRPIIDAYVAKLGLDPIVDPSNDDRTLRRNILRHDVLPQMESRFPGAAAALARYAELAAADDRALDDLATAALAAAMAGPALDSEALSAQPLALQRRIVRLWLQTTTGSEEFSANRIDAILALARPGPGGRSIEIGEGWTVRARRGMLRLEQFGTDRSADGGGHMSDVEPRANGVARILIDDVAIRRRTTEMARALDVEYGADVPLLVGVLNGAITFMTDLMRAMTIPLEVDFMAVSSYGAATRSSGVVRILKDLDQEIEGRRVIVVEDIVDSGLTLQYLLDVLQRRNPRDIRVVALLKKDNPDAIEVQVDQIGFTIPDEFVIGYGLDYAGKYRNLPYVAVLDPRVYARE
jgi:hypoxanthine phosphoribosyltransferase